jgi:hypothetical protein
MLKKIEAEATLEYLCGRWVRSIIPCGNSVLPTLNHSTLPTQHHGVLVGGGRYSASSAGARCEGRSSHLASPG